MTYIEWHSDTLSYCSIIWPYNTYFLHHILNPPNQRTRAPLSFRINLNLNDLQINEYKVSRSEKASRASCPFSFPVVKVSGWDCAPKCWPLTVKSVDRAIQITLCTVQLKVFGNCPRLCCRHPEAMWQGFPTCTDWILCQCYWSL